MRTIIIEDEPLAMRHLRSILELKCTNIEIIGTAENGLEGLEKIRLLKPDVVVTDIKMPAMDGIELASRIREEFPSIYVVIVSGYQDFEYAKKAIKFGVVDYLTKPINIAHARDTFDSMNKKLRMAYYEKRVGILKHMIYGIPVARERIEKYLPFNHYSAAIIRNNGLPSRFSARYLKEQNSTLMEAERLSCMIKDKEHNLSDGDLFDEICPFMIENDIWCFTGRDENELLFFHTSELTGKDIFKTAVAEFASGLNSAFHTVVYHTGDITLPESKRLVTELYRTLDHKIVIGLSQTIYGISDHRSVYGRGEYFDAALGGRMKYLITNGLFEEIREEIIKLFIKWENERYTQIKVESNLRQLLYYIESHSVANRSSSCFDTEFMLDEALSYSVSFGDLMVSTWEMIKAMLHYNEKTVSKIDSPVFFNLITGYLEKNLAEQISLQSVCSVFGISQTYMSRLFRKYKKTSYNEYLTLLRIEKAKQLIAQNPDIQIKDVADMVGFNNPFYFSHVFRTVTGVPPSEYYRKIE